VKKLISFFKPVILFGARTYWFVFRPKTSGAKVVLANNGDILLVKNTYGYALALPGGGLKKNEKPEDGARRELKEELGIEVEKLEYLGIIVSKAEYKNDTIHVFSADVPSRDVDIDNLEIEKAEWMPPADIKGAGAVTLQLIDLYKRSVMR
jgi:8-oxo-dGTP pyrophosphatase MutT (NUDIX family)